MKEVNKHFLFFFFLGPLFSGEYEMKDPKSPDEM